MGKSKKKSKANEKRKIILVIFALFVMAIILLISEIVGLNRNTRRNSEVTANSNNNSQEPSNDNNEEEDNVVKFESFLNEEFSMQELDNMSINDLVNIYKNSEEKEVSISDCIQLAGSTESIEGAIINAKNVFYSNNQFINSCKIIEENDYYYIVEVDYTYIAPNVTNNYIQKVLVIKESIYDDETEIFKQDVGYEDIKIIFDLKYYLKFHSNGNKSLIQSYIREQNNESTYTVYYFVANYGQANTDDTINLMKDIVHVNNKTGEIIDKEEIEVKSGIRV